MGPHRVRQGEPRADQTRMNRFHRSHEDNEFESCCRRFHAVTGPIALQRSGATASATVSVSFEFFPPGDDAAAGHLWDAVLRLAPLRPRFVSVTYGADGSTRSRTHDCVMRILRNTDLTVAPHLTCIGAPRDEVMGIAQEYWRQGVRHMVALRGDAAPGAPYSPHPGGFAFGADLVRGWRSAAPFDISVAAYPEGHPESGTIEADLDNLKRKIDAGARRATRL